MNSNGVSLKSYNVHVYTIVRVEIKNIQASSPKEAAELAATEDFYDRFKSDDSEWAVQHESYLVDPLDENGEVDYDHPSFFLDTCQVAAMLYDLKIETPRI